MNEEIEGFVPPTHPPQMGADENSPLRNLMIEAPGWNDSYAVELAVLCRRHVVIRSAIGFALELAQRNNQILLNENDPNAIFRLQGSIRGLQQFWQALMITMENPPESKETQQ